jgi:leucyl aminopeptidase
MKIEFNTVIPAIARVAAQHVLVVFTRGTPESNVFAGVRLLGVRTRQLDGKKKSDVPAKPIAADVDGRLIVWVEIDVTESVFAQQTMLRKGFELLAKESMSTLALVVHADDAHATSLAAHAVYVAAVNSQYQLGKPVDAKKKVVVPALAGITMYGTGKRVASEVSAAVARASGNLLARTLIMRPANDLTPKRYRADIARLAKLQGWKHKEYDFSALKKMGAGAFCAVAQGSNHRDAAIVHLRYVPKNVQKNVLGKKSSAPIALIGKGICMDTGGHSLKSAKYMYGMHEDMAGSAVALGILLAATEMQWDTPIDAWLAISQNHIGPDAYHPGDVVTALNGTSIEIINTDAEGRMVLADTLTLAARSKPRVMVDFATLTGSMIYALANRRSGVFVTDETLAAQAIESGVASGERVTVFPFDADYDDALDSKIADIKQCLMGGEGDAIYAARFLSKFIEGTPWVHMDLSAYKNEGGLGAVSAEVNGFGVGWGVAMLQRLAAY